MLKWSALRLQDASKWVLGKELGAGATGSVWDVDSQLYSNVVIKKGQYDRILKEAQCLSQLNHPNVAKVFAFVVPHIVKDRQRLGYMVVEKLGPSIQAMRDAKKMCVLLSSHSYIPH